jgi:hypothetical protein
LDNRRGPNGSLIGGKMFNFRTESKKASGNPEAFHAHEQHDYFSPLVIFMLIFIFINPKGLIIRQVACTFTLIQFVSHELLRRAVILLPNLLELGKNIAFGAIAAILVRAYIQLAQVKQLDFVTQTLRR